MINDFLDTLQKNFATIFGIGAILFLLILAIILVNNSENKEIPMCKEICISNNLNYYNYKNGVYENSVCFCKNEDGAINTFLI